MSKQILRLKADGTCVLYAEVLGETITVAKLKNLDEANRLLENIRFFRRK